MIKPTRYVSTVVSILLLAVVAPNAADAQVTVGGTDDPNCFPFGCPFGDHYQQVYSGSAFGTPLSIGGLTFFNRDVGYVAPGTYTFSFSTTSKGPTTLEATYANNVGSPLAFFSTLIATAGAVGGSSFSVTGMPYLYDPTFGNLLLDIQYSQTGAQATGDRFWSAGTSTETGRVYGFDPTGINNSLSVNYGLLTQFDAAVVSTVPEPSSVVLIGTGLIGVFGVSRYRLRRKIRVSAA